MSTLVSSYSEGLIDAIVHVAAPVSFDKSSDELFHGTYHGTLHIVRQSIDIGIKKVIITGTFFTLRRKRVWELAKENPDVESFLPAGLVWFPLPSLVVIVATVALHTHTHAAVRGFALRLDVHLDTLLLSAHPSRSL
ncbi:hypothetical protein BT96DRAFT_1002304 [Gymnopus androsaceus JB14]|uniref:3-beta hydroxysteroid dehydrogenase/isomerase domain-containing protein n=1 Tax=Gymnopus androsaceus JB14 TaxID=1447944 RepID=A0A6A4GZI1_9AGAR|nr:hypothetical protein BT96DRAFT_1002304 [Gymnopus androsaceus JB14]